MSIIKEMELDHLRNEHDTQSTTARRVFNYATDDTNLMEMSSTYEQKKLSALTGNSHITYSIQHSENTNRFVKLNLSVIICFGRVLPLGCIAFKGFEPFP